MGFVVPLILMLAMGLASSASANPVVAVAIVTYPLLLLGIIPIILVEAGVLRLLLHENWPRILAASCLANLSSTLVGVPFMWTLQHYLQATTIGFPPSLADASYKPPVKILDFIFGAAYSYGGDYWDIQIKAVVSLILAFLTAVQVEYWVYRLVLRGSDPKKLKKCSWLANAATYAPILAILLSLIAYQAITGRPAEAYYRWLNKASRLFH